MLTIRPFVSSQSNTYPLEIKKKSKESSDSKFAIGLFNIECSTAATTSHSTRHQEADEKHSEIDSPLDSILKFSKDDSKILHFDQDSPKHFRGIKHSSRKNKKESIKLNFQILSEFRVKPKVNFSRLKLKFKRDKQQSQLIQKQLKGFLQPLPKHDAHFL